MNESIQNPNELNKAHIPQGTSRRDFLKRAATSLVQGGLLLGAITLPTYNAQACDSNVCPSNNVCTEPDHCNNNNNCNQYNKCDDHSCGNTDTCGVSNRCTTNDGCHTDSWRSVCKYRPMRLRFLPAGKCLRLQYLHEPEFL